MGETVEQEKSQATTTKETTTTTNNNQTTRQVGNHLVGIITYLPTYLPTYLFACFAALVDGEEEETKPTGGWMGGQEVFGRY